MEEGKIKPDYRDGPAWVVPAIPCGLILGTGLPAGFVAEVIERVQHLPASNTNEVLMGMGGIGLVGVAVAEMVRRKYLATKRT